MNALDSFWYFIYLNVLFCISGIYARVCVRMCVRMVVSL